jgi:glutamate/tyrosine decarboxylase-like PLP-dependent enzyme
LDSPESLSVYRELLSRAAEKAQEYLAALPDRPPLVPDCDGELRRHMGGALPASPSTPREVLELLLEGADLGICPSGSGRYFGYVAGGILPVALAADWLTSVWDQACSVYELSPLTSVLEDVCQQWLIGLFGLPPDTSVSFTPACTYASLLGLAAARHKVLAGHGWDVTTQGMTGAPPVTVLVNEAIHASVLRSLHVLGLGGGIRELATAGQGRITPQALAAGLKQAAGTPVIVCGHVGEVNTGAVDDLPLLASSVHLAGGWLHLDAAFGMWAAATRRRHTLLRGLDLADSWATDAHKWLNVPYDCGIAFIADPAAHRAALAAAPDYLNHGNARQRHPMQWELGFARRSRVIPVWAALRQLGKDGVAQMVDRHCALARRLAAHLATEPGVHVAGEVVLNQVPVWFEHPSRDSDTHTRQVAEAFQHQGVAWASTSRWNGHSVLRLSIINWATTEQDIDRAAGSLIACHRTLVQASG